MGAAQAVSVQQSQRAASCLMRSASAALAAAAASAATRSRRSVSAAYSSGVSAAPRGGSTPGVEGGRSTRLPELCRTKPSAGRSPEPSLAKMLL